jgi:hypothetical protein
MVVLTRHPRVHRTTKRLQNYKFPLGQTEAVKREAEEDWGKRHT